MRILIPLLVFCSYASANSSIGGYNYQTPWNYYPYQNYSGWHAPQQTHQSPLSKARQDLTASLTDLVTDPMNMVGVGGVGAQLYIRVPNPVWLTTFLVTEQQHLLNFHFFTQALANAVYTSVATAGVTATVVAANARIDASNKRITTVETRSSNTCSQVIQCLWNLIYRR